MDVIYLWAKFLKKIRGSSVIGSGIHKTSKVESGSHIVNTTFAKHSFCGYDCEIVNCDIGSFCSIASNVVIGGGMHPMEWVSTSPVFYAGRDSVKAKFATHPRESHKRTQIGHDVWIGRNALVSQGVKIGTGAVVGMGSVVTHDVPPYAIVAGVPAKILRMRFSDEIVRELLRSEWWLASEELLHKLGSLVNSPEKFLIELRKNKDEKK
jgi:acetyltransferase-like isoleucine patch superfamily enzyme